MGLQWTSSKSTGVLWHWFHHQGEWINWVQVVSQWCHARTHSTLLEERDGLKLTNWRPITYSISSNWFFFCTKALQKTSKMFFYVFNTSLMIYFLCLIQYNLLRSQSNIQFLKLDSRKAYDRLDWRFIFKVMENIINAWLLLPLWIECCSKMLPFCQYNQAMKHFDLHRDVR